MATSDGPAYVKLISAEGHEFYVDRKCANTSGTIKAMLSGQFAESSGEVKFPEISTAILEKVIQYFYYKLRYTNSQSRIPEFHIEPEIALELLMAANFLDC
ncbi:BTB/POZ protein [Pelagophyceae sp. CCMP2097]|nr:BTB/POZ protein [Pelagophyceae sp. CCMP2097]